MTMQPSIRGGRSRGAAIQVLRSIATTRPGLIAIAALAIGSGLALNWGSLVALGAAPLILGILPCAAMCAVGLCMPMGGARKKAPPLIDATVNPVRPDHETLVIVATPRTETGLSSTLRSQPNL